MSHYFRAFLVVSMLVGMASTHAGFRKNGEDHNGFRKNGIQLNRLAFNGAKVDAQPQLSGIALDRVGVR